MLTAKDLLAIPKCVVGTPKRKSKSRPEFDAWEIDLDFPQTPQALGEFAAFIRVNKKLPESFSIGLRYSERGVKPAVILRVNGDHGPHQNPDATLVNGPHVHFPTEDQMCRRPPPSSWDGGPSTVFAIDGNFLLLRNAWRLFCEKGSMSSSPEVDRFVSALSAKLTQLDF